MFLFYVNATPTTEIYTLSLHDALPICLGGGKLPRLDLRRHASARDLCHERHPPGGAVLRRLQPDRKSTRLNSSHLGISYAVFCLKKKKTTKKNKKVKTKKNK